MIPQEFIDILETAHRKLAGALKVKSFRYFTGDQECAHKSDFDDSKWVLSGPAVFCRRHQGNTWFRFKITVPASIEGIRISGSELRLRSFFLAPTKIYINGIMEFSEKTWVDFKIPEIIVTKYAVPGQSFTAAVLIEFGENCHWDNTFYMDCVFDVIDDACFEIKSFISELEYIKKYKDTRDKIDALTQMFYAECSPKWRIPVLLKKIKEARIRLEYIRSTAKRNTVHLIGHAHIDMNWFWGMEETIDIIKRDFDTMIGIMEEKPDFKFSQSQCAVYDIAKIYHPAVFEKIKKHVLRGNWDITASAWVEGDLNMVSGESLVRQILYSKLFLSEHFGLEPYVMWCPDTFGHSANIPQVLIKSGIKYYFFMRGEKQQHGANTDLGPFFSNKAPDQIFIWEGIDGSRVIAFNSLYSAELNAAGIINIANNLDKGSDLKNSMFVYGTGDHGGGPTIRDIQRAVILSDHPTMPNIIFSTVHDFFDAVCLEDLSRLAVINGEMNFVFSGCYTSHPDIKRYNRLCENLLYSAEIISTAATLAGSWYDKVQIYDCWIKTLFNQFHDILCGTGTKATYIYSALKADEVISSLNDIIKCQMSFIASRLDNRCDDTESILVFNTAGWERSGLLVIPGSYQKGCAISAIDATGQSFDAQIINEGICVYLKGIPACGYKTLHITCDKDTQEYESVRTDDKYYSISTEIYDIEIKKDSGQITTLYDKRYDRYTVKKEQFGWLPSTGVLNTFVIQYEAPAPYSAWSIGPVTKEEYLISDAESYIIEDGPVRKRICFIHKFNDSEIKQEIMIGTQSPRIDFHNQIRWNERGAHDMEAPMLRVVFTPDIKNKDALYQIPFGTVKRPNNNCEVPSSGFAYIEDGHTSFAVLNDCKYGYKVCGNMIELNLIRSSWLPDPEAGVGDHEFTYSMISGNIHDEAEVLKETAFLNYPVITTQIYYQTESSPQVDRRSSLVSINKCNIVISALKPCERSDGYILRIYEATGIKTKAGISLGFDIDTIDETDMIETNVIRSVYHENGRFETEFGEFEIKTFLIRGKNINLKGGSSD